MIIHWTNKIPKRPGFYLVKSLESGQITAMNITKLDLDTVKVDDHWLSGVYFSKQTIKEVLPK